MKKNQAGSSSNHASNEHKNVSGGGRVDNNPNWNWSNYDGYNGSSKNKAIREQYEKTYTGNPDTQMYGCSSSSSSQKKK